MISILLGVLKILAILLLAVIGTLLFLLILLLTVPIRYRIQGKYETEPSAEAQASWLLHLLKAEVFYKKDLLIRVKVCGFTVFSTEEDEEELKEDLEDSIEEGAEQAEKAADIVLDVSEPVNNSAESECRPESVEVSAEPENMTEPVNASEEQNKKSESESGAEESGEKSTSESAAEDSDERAEPESAAREPDETYKSKSEQTEETNRDKKPGFLKRLQIKLRKIRKKELLARRSADRKMKDLEKKKDQIVEFLSDKRNQRTLRILKDQIIRLLKHIMPKCIEGTVKFGFDDPYLTGQILTWISPFYSLYAKSLVIIPVFEEKILTGVLQLKGRIRIGTLLLIAIRVVLDKNFRRLFREYRKRR